MTTAEARGETLRARREPGESRSVGRDGKMDASSGLELTAIGLAFMRDSTDIAASIDEDGALVAACQRGDRAAFDLIVERHQRSIYRLCFRFVNNHEDASDLVQEVFIKAYRGIRRFRGDSSLATWLYRIAVNTCLSFRSSRRPSTEELSDSIGAESTDFIERLERDERSRRVREAVRRLPERQRMTLILKVYHDLKHEDVARIMGTTVGTTKANLFHALSNLKRLVAEGQGGAP
jgi:RNA polymerase sigma-70 factor (ECF subfamily)